MERNIARVLKCPTKSTFDMGVQRASHERSDGAWRRKEVMSESILNICSTQFKNN